MIIWSLFILMIGVFLALDLRVFNKNAHEITYKEAGRWTAVWTTLGLSFSFLVYFIYQNNWLGEMAKTSLPLTASIEYLTGYIIELTLSIDNIFVIAMIFKSFKILKVPASCIILGNCRGFIIPWINDFFRRGLIEQFKWTTYVFGAFLIFTAIRMAFSNDEEEFDPKQSWVYRTIRRVMPVTGRIDGQKFIIKKGVSSSELLLLALILIEFTDILFALDSIPAILAITTDPFIVFTSNIFAILGLRSMYFFVANMLDSFHYLKYSLTVILIYVGIKLVLANHYHLPWVFHWVSSLYP